MTGRLLRQLPLRVRLTLQDGVRNSRLVWRAWSLLCALRALSARQVPASSLLFWARAYRMAGSGPWRRQLRARLTPWLAPERAAIWREERIGWGRLEHRIGERQLGKSLLLKEPIGGREKGVLYVSFEYNWLRLVAYHDLRALLREYFLVVCTSQSPPAYELCWALAHAGPDPVFVQVSNPADVSDLRELGGNLEPLPIMACDWVNPAHYQPKPHRSREIDLLMVGGWNHFKRHFLLFRALRRMKRDLRVVLVGQDDIWRSDEIYRQAAAYGVSHRIEIVSNASPELVARLQCDSRASVVLSSREGSSVVVAESFFADAPVAMLKGAHVGARAYINEQTGVLADADSLHVRLSALVEQSECYQARSWAESHISCSHTTRKLGAILRSRSGCWTRDIAPLCWRPDPTYVDPEDDRRLLPAREDLRRRHGVALAGS